MRATWKSGFFILVGFFAALLIGAGALFALLAPASHVPPVTQAAASTSPSPTLRTRAIPTRVGLTPTRTPTVVSSPDVVLSLVSVDRQPSQGGMTVTIDLSNHRSSALSFAFDPNYDVRVQDARGNAWSLRWAEYKGSPNVASGSTEQLARAFFAGPVDNQAVWPVAVSVERIPGVGKTIWRVPQSGPPPTLASVAKLPTVPTVTASGPITLSAANPEVDSGLGGVQVDLLIENRQANDVVFNFDPNSQITAQDNLGRPYHLGWAQYAGSVHIGPNGTNRLARAFFEGPIGDAKASWLTIQIRQVPGTSVLATNVPLQ